MSWRALFYWSVRRELWEHRGVYFMPLGGAVLAFVGFFLYLAGLVSGSVVIKVGSQEVVGAFPYGAAASMILFLGWFVSVFYAADALHAERRDRSILFWKSMPVPDLVTIAAKACMAMLVIPFIAFVVAWVMQLAMLGTASVVYAATGREAAAAWNTWPIAQEAVVMLYSVVIHALWFAPIYAWLLLVSAWAPRAPLLMALVPVIGLSILERIAIGTSRLPSMISYRVMGATSEGFAPGAFAQPVTPLSQLEPVRFFSSPNLWLGLAVAAGCLALAVWTRRHREPT